MTHHFVEPVVIPLDAVGETMDPPVDPPPAGPGGPAPDVVTDGTPQDDPDPAPDGDEDPEMPADPVPG